jgi:alcohol dehydrogenase
VGSVVNTARVPAGASVAVVGLGGVGLTALLAARLVGAGDIIGIDFSPDKLTLARDLGATAVFDARDEACAEAVREATSGGVDFAFEMAGSVKAMDLAYRITRRGGTTVTAGLSNPEHDFSVKHVSLVAEERCVMGSYIGSCVPLRDIPRYVALHEGGRLAIERLMSGHIGLDDINAAFDKLADGSVMRQVVMF